MRVRKVRTVIICLSQQREGKEKQSIPSAEAASCLCGSKATGFSWRMLPSSKVEEEECCIMFEAVH